MEVTPISTPTPELPSTTYLSTSLLAHCPEHFPRFRGRVAVNFTVTTLQHWLALDDSRYPSSSFTHSPTMMRYANRSTYDIHER